MKTNSINNNKPTFTNITTLGAGLSAAGKFMAMQEGGGGLSHVRFIQDTATCLAPKAAFARSKADLAENTFLEVCESVLVYYCPMIIGEKIFRKLYSKGLSEEAKKLVSTRAYELLDNKSPHSKALMPVKAAIALGAMAIPLTEYALNYIKNGMTLKIFKQGNFDNIANLDKGNKIDKELNDKVEKSAKKNVKRAAIAYAGCVAAGTLIAAKGKNSKILQNISEFVLAPGTKLFKNKEKTKKIINKYFSLDFKNNEGKLALSNGQVTSCVLIGGAGYFGASKDRGKQNFLETLFRFPLVGLYIICGNELLESGFKKYLLKKGKCKEVLNDKLEVTSMKDLKESAKNIIAKNGGNFDDVYKKMLKQKTLIAGVPLAFGIGVMGFFMAGLSVVFTKYRYNKEQAKNSERANLMPPQNMSSFLGSANAKYL